MNPIVNEWFSQWMLPYLAPYIVATMYDEKTVEKQLKLMKGETHGK